MAEIKSTMEMVLERAARMAEAAPEVTENEDLVKTGMKLAADYIKSGNADFAATIGSNSPEDQVSIKKGMAQTLLRNIVLPRDEELQATGQTALQGIQRGMRSMRRNAAEIASPQEASATFPTKDSIRSLVELHQNKNHTLASIKVLQTADEMVGSLLDVKA